MDVLNHFLNFIFMLLCGWLAAYLGAKKGRSAILWFFLGFFINVFALLFLIFLPPVAKRPSQAQKPESPFSGTTIDVKPIATDEKEETLSRPDRKEWYYLDQQRQQVGPLSFQMLDQLYRSLAISDTTYLWCEGMNEWRKLSEFKNLFK